MRRIYVDIDDVLAQTGRMFLRVLEQEMGKVVAFDSMGTFHLGDSLGLGPDELESFLQRVHESDALASVEPMPGAIDTLDAWETAGYDVWVVTGRPPETHDATVAWLAAHEVPHTEFHFLDKYSGYYDRDGTPEGTLTLADLPALEFCLAVEDFPGMAEHLATEVNVPVVLFDRPWNRSWQYPADSEGATVVRCEAWSGIRTRFQRP